MDQITFSLGCRACRETDSERWTYGYDDPEGRHPLADQSDFGIMRNVEALNRERGVACPFCGSPDLEVFDLAANGQPLFDFDRLRQLFTRPGLAIFSLTIDKVAGQLRSHLGLDPAQVDPGFLALVLNTLVTLLNERPGHDFASDANGNFYACLVGYWETGVPDTLVQPQKYTCRSLTREEILWVIESLKGNLAIS